MLADLPAPLSRDEESALFAIIKDEERPRPERDEARNLIIMHNSRYVAKFAKEYVDRRPGSARFLDDIFSDLMAQVPYIIGAYRHDIGVKFITYLANCLYHHATRSLKRHAMTVQTPANLPGWSPYGNASSLGEWTGDVEAEPPTDRIENEEDIERLRAAIGRLPRRERGILRRRMEGESLSRIGATEGVSKERIRQLECQAVCRIRATFRVREMRREVTA